MQAADALVKTGLVEHGWCYVNIDDGWQGERGGELNSIQPNKKFPDMAALGQKVHDLGLRLGIYSSPWCGTYEGHIGSNCDEEDGSYHWVKSRGS